MLSPKKLLRTCAGTTAAIKKAFVPERQQTAASNTLRTVPSQTHNGIIVFIHIAAAFQTYFDMSTSTATRATRVGKMTKEDNSDIVAADTATAQGKTESNVAAVETVTATADTASATVTEQSNDADKLNSSKEEEQKKEASAAATSATATANAGDASVKPDATMTEATPVAHDTISGDVEFTANFPQKVRSTNLRVFYLLSTIDSPNTCYRVIKHRYESIP